MLWNPLLMCIEGGAREGLVAARSVHFIFGASSSRTRQLRKLAAGGSFRINRGSCRVLWPRWTCTRLWQMFLSSCVCARTHCSSSLLWVFFFFFFFFFFCCQTLSQSSPQCDCWNKTEAGVKLPRSRSRLDRKVLSGIRFYTGAHKAGCSKKKGDFFKKKKMFSRTCWLITLDDSPTQRKKEDCRWIAFNNSITEKETPFFDFSGERAFLST